MASIPSKIRVRDVCILLRENICQMKQQDPVISVLLEENILDDDNIKKLVDEQSKSGKSLISLLKSGSLVDKDQLTRLTAISNGIEFVDLTADMIDPVAVRLVSYDTARQHNLIPVRIEKDSLYVAMSSPLNLSTRDAITTKTGYKVIPLAATAEAVMQAISNHFDVDSVTKQDIVAMRLKDSSEVDTRTKKARAKSGKVADAPIVRLVDSIITGGIDARCSDIHLEPFEHDFKVRYRVDGGDSHLPRLPLPGDRPFGRGDRGGAPELREVVPDSIPPPADRRVPDRGASRGEVHPHLRARCPVLRAGSRRNATGAARRCGARWPVDQHLASLS